jgi:FMN phosphatase YigB (HAD superfamily)
MPTPSFIYFDLGNVLLNFSHELGCAQMAEVAGVSVDDVRQFAYDSPMAKAYERGEISTRDFYDFFCEQTKTAPNYERLITAGSDIFTINASILPIITQLRQRCWRTGILSNTCDMHWQWITSGRFAILPAYFDVIALSFEIGSTKPDRDIFTAAANKAGVAPEEIFYTDDIAGHVEGARQAGFDAERFTSAGKLAMDLRVRGVELTI